MNLLRQKLSSQFIQPKQHSITATSYCHTTSESCRTAAQSIRTKIDNTVNRWESTTDYYLHVHWCHSDVYVTLKDRKRPMGGKTTTTRSGIRETATTRNVVLWLF